MEHLDVAPILIIIATVLLSSRNTLNLLCLRANVPHFRILHDLFPLISSHLVPILFQRLLRSHGQSHALRVPANPGSRCQTHLVEVKVTEGEEMEL